MQLKKRDVFTTIRVLGALFSPELLQRIALGDQIEGLRPEDYHISGNRKLSEAISEAWSKSLSNWASFKEAREKLPSTDLGTSITRERWLLRLFSDLNFGRLVPSRSIELTGSTYPVSHMWNNTPIHLVGSNLSLDHRTAGAIGAARMSPHSLVQTLLNRHGDMLWGFVSNGLKLRILRDNISLTRQAYVEFDLEAMLEGEVYSDFVLLWLLCHQSRVEGEKPEHCWLEQWSKLAAEQGTRALDQLRSGVEAALNSLGTGFLTHKANKELRDRLREGRLTTQDYYRQLLRLVYRLIFLCVAEDRELLYDPNAKPESRQRYVQFYSLTRLRQLSERRKGTAHADLYQGLLVVMGHLERGCEPLALPGLGSFLWSSEAVPDLLHVQLPNSFLLAAIRSLSQVADGNVRRTVDYRNLGAEELGSIYESLLERHPEVNLDTELFNLQIVSGNERKTTGSYYTPTSLINSLLDSALEPVLDEAGKKADPEKAILQLKVCDPACGSGHFLIAAAHRMAKRLAYVRTGDEEPSPDATRKALRDIIGRCIYGVDINEMAVELCKVSLWMEALEPGKALSFLDHHIQCGNSLLGATPALLKAGIPDEAFAAIEGDDKKLCTEYRKRNKQERERNIRSLFDPATDEAWHRLGNFSAAMLQLEDLPDDTMAAHEKKAQLYERHVKSSEYMFGRLWADAWCAAFVWKKSKGAPFAITNETFRRIEESPFKVAKEIRDEVQRLAMQYKFLHWHLSFPGVFRVPVKGEQPTNPQTGWLGGFDVVLGNPPWERVKLQEKEWFAPVRPDIADAPNAALRRKLIDELAKTEPHIYNAFLEDRRKAEGESHLLRSSGRFPLCGRGDINTYAVFAETNRMIVGSTGMTGFIVPTGIATDDTTKFFFGDLVNTNTLVSLYDFENREKLFPAVDSRMKFCLLTIAGNSMPGKKAAQFIFFAQNASALEDDEKRFTLTAEEIALLNPNTKTCPVFRSKRDAELTKAIYRRVPILIKEGPPEENPWGISFMRMFDMSNDSHLFKTRRELEDDGWQLDGNVFRKGEESYLPLYEAKMFHHYDHRWATYQGVQDIVDVEEVTKDCPQVHVMPQYWIHKTDVENRLGRCEGASSWFLGFRDITNTTNERTVISTALPYVATSNKIPLVSVSIEHASTKVVLSANLSAYVLDYVTRQKVGGTTLNFFIAKQLPVIQPTLYSQKCPWAKHVLFSWFSDRVLELSCTAVDMTALASNIGRPLVVFRYLPHRRLMLRAELDAAFFHLYGISREDVAYIMDTFPIVRRNDEAKYGSYRTKELILSIYDQMQQAIDTGVPYKTLLNPPPGDPSLTHKI
jgi:hypothetical protein